MNKLENHLIAITKPVTDKAFLVLGKGYRISVLTDRLIRLETTLGSDEYIDHATQRVWFRSFATPQFKVKDSDRNVIIATDSIHFSYNKENGICKVKFPDGRIVTCSNEGNLKGTARTLDNKQGAVKLDMGIVSRTGVAVLEDDSLFLEEDGKVGPRTIEVKDRYIFAYDKDFRGALKDFYQLTGSVPLIPRYALGNWWSRYKVYTQEEYTDLMKRFQEEKVPLSVATIDMDWHWTNVDKRFGAKREPSGRIYDRVGWTGYSWNTELFPDYKGFLTWLHDQNLKITLNLHPAQGVRFFEDMYQDIALEMGIDPVTKTTVPFDITSEKFINAYFKLLHKPYEEQGVDFWWIDWQQGKKSGIEGLDPLWSLNHYHYYDNSVTASGRKRPLILSRYAGPGSHRYPLGFSGDTLVKWSALEFQPYFTINSANIGYTWWSHDIGGHMLGQKDDEMYLRWLQFGVFSPINRLHSTSNELQGKEPWKYRSDVCRYAKDFLNLRHKLLPYLYTMNYRTHTEGIPLCEPMYYSYPQEETAYAVKNQYMFGDSLIVCPITKKADSKTGLSGVEAWIPEGRWTDLFTGMVYEKSGIKELFRDESSIPVLAKAGAIIPMDAKVSNGCNLPNSLEVLIYRGNGSFALYEDDGESLDYVAHHVLTDMKVIEDTETNCLSFQISASRGDVSLLPQTRDYSLKFADVIQGQVEVLINGFPTENEVTMHPLSLTLKEVSPSDQISVTISNIQVLKNMDYKQWAIELMTKVQCGNLKKMFRYPRINKATTQTEFIKNIEKCGFPRQIRKAVEEIL